jgi:phosphoribosylformylglycinamidine synthase
MRDHFNIEVKPIWHTERTLPKLHGVIIPGGFSYGDYLRCGGLAALSPIIGELKKFVDQGGAVIGICNGFQILTESHILPGALLPNRDGKFICRPVDLTTEGNKTQWAKAVGRKSVRMPIAHGEGRYLADADTVKRLHDEDRILFKYCGENPNGSIDSIAGILSKNKKVLGMMPHPERAIDTSIGGSGDGLQVWKAFLAHCI